MMVPDMVLVPKEFTVDLFHGLLALGHRIVMDIVWCGLKVHCPATVIVDRVQLETVEPALLARPSKTLCRCILKLRQTAMG